LKRNIIPEKLKVWFSNLRKSKGYKIFKKIMLGTVSAGITMAILLTCSFVFLCYNYTDSDIDIAFENLNLDYTTVIYAKNTQTGKYEAVEELYKDENRIWISLDTLPKYIKDATIAIEDRRFEKHKGVDWWRTGQAVFKYALGDRSGFGGSTLTQQLIKNITGDGARSIERKIKEILRALYIERKYNKDQILEYYLNTVTFGGTCQGIQSAAKRYFNKDATELTLVEAASIIGITNNPSLYDPFLKEENNKNRARTIMYTMLEEGFITQEEYDAAKEELGKQMNVVVAKTEVELTVNDPVLKDDNGNPVRIVRRAETNLADLCADAFRQQGNAEIGMVNGGGVRKSIPAGDITYKDIIDVFPFGNYMTVVEVSGQQILDALEWGVRFTPQQSGSFLQVSGLSFEVDLSVPSGCQSDDMSMYTGIEGERRIKNVKVNGEDIVPDQKYTLASTDYILKQNGDGYTMFDGATVLQDAVKLDNQVLIDFITEYLGGIIAEEYENPYGQGRINILNGE